MKLTLWIFRQTDRDIIKLYNSLIPYIRIAMNISDNYMLNFGYWTKNNDDPVDAQRQLSTKVGKFAKFDTVEMIADVGSGFSAPAVQWRSQYPHLKILCVDINFMELNAARKEVIMPLGLLPDRISLINASSAMLPFGKGKLDMIIAFESAQHFQSIKNFLEVSRSILKPGGLIVLAIPIVDLHYLESENQKKDQKESFMKKVRLMNKLGILHFTWASLHYDINTVLRSVTDSGYRIEEFQRIGHYVYEPLAEYYFRNRKEIRHRLIQHLTSYKQRGLFKVIEYMVYRSALKMKTLSMNGSLDYVLIRASKDDLGIDF